MDGSSTTERDGLITGLTLGIPTASESALEGDVPSCLGCRRRKLRCSREQPICLHCKRLGMCINSSLLVHLSFGLTRLESPCVYDAKKNKPGIKLGAVGSLSRRVGKSPKFACISSATDPINL